MPTWVGQGGRFTVGGRGARGVGRVKVGRRRGRVNRGVGRVRVGGQGGRATVGGRGVGRVKVGGQGGRVNMRVRVGGHEAGEAGMLG